MSQSFKGSEFNPKLHISLFDSIIKDNERTMQARGATNTNNDNFVLSKLVEGQPLHRLIL